jgi:hypothetical protein
VYRTRTRMVSFRLSEEEYERLKDLSISERARSISDFARMALCRLPGSESASGREGPRVDKLEGTVGQLKVDMRELREMLQALLSRIPERAKAAGAQETTQ